jgi:hypothetical protein
MRTPRQDAAVYCNKAARLPQEKVTLRVDKIYPAPLGCEHAGDIAAVSAPRIRPQVAGQVPER